MKFLFCLVIMLWASTASASDTIGFYFDTDASSNITSTTVPGELVMGYLVMHDASHQESIGQWRANIELVSLDGPDPSVIWQLPSGMQNLQTTPEFDVWTLNPLPWAEDIILATAYIVVPHPNIEVEVLASAPRVIELYSPGGFPIRQPVYGYSSDYIQAPLTQTSGSSYQPIALINNNYHPVPWPTFTTHWISGNSGNVVLGDQVWGAMRAFIYSNDGIPNRTFETVMHPRGNGTYLRQVGDMYSPWGNSIYGDSQDSVWVEMRTGDFPVFPSILWYANADSLGDHQRYGVEFSSGADDYELTREVNVYPDPCVVRGVYTWGQPYETNWDSTPYDLGWTPVGVTRDFWIYILNIKEPELFLEADFTGSPAFTLLDVLPESVSGESVRSVQVRFAPESPGIHEASLTWGNELCETVNLVGTGRVSSDAPVPGAGQTQLLANYPNPFNPTTSIAYELAQAGRAHIAVHDLHGRLVRTLLSESRPAGRDQVMWDGTDASGRSVASGTYLVSFEAAEIHQSRQITLLK